MKPTDMPLEVWEALCRKCGKCCSEKIDIDGRIYSSKKYCRFLDTSVMQCTVYEDRFVAEPGCLSVPEGVKVGVFPADCPYIQDVEGYVPTVEEWDNPAIDQAIREILGEDAV